MISPFSTNTKYARLQDYWTMREQMEGAQEEQTFDAALIGALSGLGITDDEWKNVLEIARNETRRVAPFLKLKI